MESAAVTDEDYVAGRAEILEEMLERTERCGYGACSQCSCTAYLGNGDLCGNCQHNYSFHW
jgi:hypothetical protein